jgi:TATA-binding protein-associated factor
MISIPWIFSHARFPFQNNVLELWSLFDFLMPGFLGTEKQFYQRFGKPIILSRDAKSSSKEQEAGIREREGGGIE